MRVFFFCVKPGSPDNTGYCHGSVALAEGLKALGVEVYGNVPYWQRSPDPASVLIPFERAVLPDDCDVVVVDSNHGINGESIPDVAKRQKRSFRSVYIDFQDGAITKTWDPELRGFDLILKMHANRRTRLPTNAQPWAFGLTERIVEAGAGGEPVSNREDVVLSGFRIPHPVRTKALDVLTAQSPDPLRFDRTIEGFDAPPLDEVANLLWRQTGRRHYPSYFQRLQRSAGVAAFGGFFIPPFPFDHTSPGHVAHRAMNKLAALAKSAPRLLQWDSWRFWESLASGCLTFHLDLEKYGAAMPVMPLPGVHYVGIDLENPLPGLEAISDVSSRNRIAEDGRAFALREYGPLPTARRLLRALDLDALPENRPPSEQIVSPI